MKKLLFTAYSLDVGGIETALITLLKELCNKYEITLALEKKQGIFLSELPENIKIITYTPSNNKIALIRKCINLCKQIKFRITYKNKFDFSACYATYSYPASFMAQVASKNRAIWVHNNYMNFYDNDIQKYRDFFKKLDIYNYKNIVFVSDMDKKVFVAQFPECRKNVVVCNNFIDYKKILKQADEKVDDFNKKDITTFINIGRHDEKQKKLSRIINAAKRLNKEGYKFRVVFVGKGVATKEYHNMARNIKNIEFLGAKKNPYPYLKNSDCLLMSSDFEGYPVVFVEAKILGKPIVTTDVSDSKTDIEGKYGIVTPRTEEGVYEGMKQYLENGFITHEFDAQEYNDEIARKLEKIIEG